MNCPVDDIGGRPMLAGPVARNGAGGGPMVASLEAGNGSGSGPMVVSPEAGNGTGGGPVVAQEADSWSLPPGLQVRSFAPGLPGVPTDCTGLCSGSSGS